MVFLSERSRLGREIDGYCYDCMQDVTCDSMSDSCPRCGSAHWVPNARPTTPGLVLRVERKHRSLEDFT